MEKRLTINIDSKLLDYTAQFFGVKNTQTNYSKIIEKALLHFLKPQFEINRNLNYEIDNKIQSLVAEPVIDIDAIEKDYDFDLSSVEGKWPGDEPIELLLEMLEQ
jgi:hypothetical protein